ncbi:uncharacterized protein LTR77_000911 [Saxophila tyrrhenica]|uniref:Phosphoglycerate mutase family protein n=1 Tax=Saxophila tyrrhenica TaxID=1690608 RepID=A0AAV9PPM9_9PEZI|nr:hypothetical protein LTR77_000911 [Saxophila tyrrhenica]
MAQQQPAVVIIARHGLRLDAADPSWHHSTPAPYDPPLTYGGWTQCRALGKRIAGLLDAREQEAADGKEKSARPHGAEYKDGIDGEERPQKKRKLKHKVVIHSSPFLRCLQTSVAIAAGMAQYKPSIETSGRPRTTSRTHSGSPRLRPVDRPSSPRLPAIAEPDLAHALAKRSLQLPKHHRKSMLRVDAFLGEWLNPEYYDQIMPPPPSPMMMTTAKAELMENENVEIFSPTVSLKTANGTLWSGTNANATTNGSRESTLDDWSLVEDAVPASPLSPGSRRRASQSSVGSIDRPKSPFRPGSALQPLTSTLPKQEAAIYHPPQPQYAVSTSDRIPRGYVAHAKNACTNVDYQWDSSRAPQNWGDGGQFGEEWSSMHKRFRRGLNHLISWYSKQDADARGEDALGVDQADHRPKSRSTDDEEQEDTVVIMVTHGAGCNALIGALTGQPVLLDVGMASLTMAVRKEDAPPITTFASSTAPSPRGSPTPEQMALNNATRRTSLDLGLSSIYDLKLVASTEHLRPSGASPSMRPVDANKQAFIDNYRQRLGAPNPSRSNTSSMLGSIRRPSAVNNIPLAAGSRDRSASLTPAAKVDSPPLSTGLWTPPGARTPTAQAQTIRPGLGTANSDTAAIRNGSLSEELRRDTPNPPNELDVQTGGVNESAQSSRPGSRHDDVLPELPQIPSPADSVPTSLARGLSQRGLWGAQPRGARVERVGREAPKRRWTVDQE